LRERSEEKQTETLEIRGEKRKGRETERGDSFLKEKGKPSKEAEERKGSDREKIYTREEEQPQLPLCFLSIATAHHLTAADTAISNRHWQPRRDRGEEEQITKKRQRRGRLRRETEETGEKEREQPPPTPPPLPRPLLLASPPLQVTFSPPLSFFSLQLHLHAERLCSAANED